MVLLLDSHPSQRRLFNWRHRRFMGLNSREQRLLRRKKKQLRLRRAQARRYG
jgi:hypothetical protein